MPRERSFDIDTESDLRAAEIHLKLQADAAAHTMLAPYSADEASPTAPRSRGTAPEPAPEAR